jgi:F-type H+-transporting ATPase subunit epsilon
MTTLLVEIVTPEVALWSGTASSLMARSSVGDFTILPQHTSTVGDLVSGIVRVDTDEGELSFCVHGGYFQVTPDGAEGVTRATVLAGIAERTSDIDVTRAHAAKDAAQEEINSAQRGDANDASALQLARDALARAELRLSIAEK